MIQKLSEDRLWSQVVAKAWADEAFRKRLMADPRAVLAEHAIDTPDGVEVRVVEDTATVRHCVLPPCPSEELTDEELIGVAVADSDSRVCGDSGGCGCGCRACRCRCD